MPFVIKSERGLKAKIIISFFFNFCILVTVLFFLFKKLNLVKFSVSLQVHIFHLLQDLDDQ
jgi:hypothetical protein